MQPQRDSWRSILHHWKRSGLWKSHFSGFDSILDIDRDELTRALEEASGPVILRNWVEVRALVLQFLTEHDTFLGKNLASFSRDEYQPKAGNLFHDHLFFFWEERNRCRDGAEVT